MKRVTVLEVKSEDEKLTVEIRHSLKGYTKDEAAHRHAQQVSRIHSAIAERFFAHNIKTR